MGHIQNMHGLLHVVSVVRRCALKLGMNFIHTNVAGNRIQAIRSARRSVILIRIRALIRIWVNQGFPAVSVWDDPCAYGQPIRVRAARTRMGYPYAYGTAHTHMGKILVWNGT